MSTVFTSHWSLLAAFVAALLIPGLVSELDSLPNTIRHQLGLAVAVFFVAAHHAGLFYLCQKAIARIKLASWPLRLLGHIAIAVLLVPTVWLAIIPLAFALGLFGSLVPHTEVASVLYWIIRFMGDIAFKSLASALIACPLVVAALAIIEANSLKFTQEGQRYG